MSVRFPTPWNVLLPLAVSGLRDRRRSFRADAIRSVSRLKPPVEISGEENVPDSGPCLVVVNHYTRPGFQAWWLALAVSARLPWDIHWVMTAAWTYPDRVRSRLITPASRRIFARLAQVYGFTAMPPMPPNPAETFERAAAVRRVLAYARTTANPVIGLAPEGGDFALPGKLATPPPGVGRFVLLLCGMGFPILPVGVYENVERLHLHFGEPSTLLAPEGLCADERDEWARVALMGRIADLLPSSEPLAE